MNWKMSAIGSQITGVSIVFSTVCSSADHRKHHSSVSLAFGEGNKPMTGGSPQRGPVTRNMFLFDDVIMSSKVFSWIRSGAIAKEVLMDLILITCAWRLHLLFCVSFNPFARGKWVKWYTQQSTYSPSSIQVNGSWMFGAKHCFIAHGHVYCNNLMITENIFLIVNNNFRSKLFV